jgi:hypothetical protein
MNCMGFAIQPKWLWFPFTWHLDCTGSDLESSLCKRSRRVLLGRPQNSRVRYRVSEHNRCIGPYRHPSHRHSVVAASPGRRQRVVAVSSRSQRHAPFARRGVNSGAMTDTKRVRLVRKKKVRSFGGRGQIYSWLRTHHAAIEPLKAVHLNLWSALAVDMVEDGVTEAADGRGLRDRIWKSWQRVCRDVAAEAAAAKPKRVPPSRISPEWRPTVVPQKPVSPTPRSISATPKLASPAPSSQEGLDGPPPPDPRIDPTYPPETQDSLRRLFKDFDDVAKSRFKF